jgi:GH15 family glucan-1,4-alpha-glucosidase
MPRDLPLSNGRLLVTFDSTYTLRDIYYPHVGMENHAYRGHSKLGIWAGGQLAWLHDEGWERSLRYATDSLVTHVEATNARLQIALTIEDAVDINRNVLVRRFAVRSTGPAAHDVRLFSHLDLAIGGNTVGDTVFYHPDYRAMVAYKNMHYLLLGGQTEAGPGLDGWTTARKADRPSWHDAEDGVLDATPIAFGSIDCMGQLRLGDVTRDVTAVAHTWLAVGPSLEEVGALHASVLQSGPDALIERTRNYWRGWAANDTSEHPGLSDLPGEIRALYRRSLLLMRAHMDHDGAIIASPDSDMAGQYSPHGRSGPSLEDVFYGHDNYSYSWGRDGSFVAMALDNAGYSSSARAFLSFCARNVTRSEDGNHAYMLQKHLANGAVASNVIPWIDHRGAPRLPIQEDETALVLIALRNHFDRSRDWEFVAEIYQSTIVPMANFLRDYRDPVTGLPLPSQDLWEERQGVHAFTVATVWRALVDAASLADLFAQPDLAEGYRVAAGEIRRGAETSIYSESVGRFVRSLHADGAASTRHELAVDASLWALAYFGMFRADDPRMTATMDAVEAMLMVPGPACGLARFEGDRFQLRQSGVDAGVVGNPWPLCTLWLAQYRLMTAKDGADLERALTLIGQVAGAALPSGALPEQVDPVSGEPAGATPLTWAHGAVVLTVLDHLAAQARIGAP